MLPSLFLRLRGLSGRINRSESELGSSQATPGENRATEAPGTGTRATCHSFSSAARYTQVTQWILTHASRETSSGRFIPEMDGLRFVAIGFVILFHLNAYFTAKSVVNFSPPPQLDWLSQIARLGFRGVELFFVISGFILALPFAGQRMQGGPRIRLSSYYLRRLTRLEPPYFSTLLIFFLLAVGIQGKEVADLYTHLGASFLYLHNIIYGTASPVLGVA